MNTTDSSPTLVIICGPPAVGKMTVGLELSALTGIPLFHNHMSIETVLDCFKHLFMLPPCYEELSAVNAVW